MRRLFSVLRTDGKMMGPNALVPVLVILGYLAVLGICAGRGVLTYEPLLRLGECMLPAFAAWWPVFVLAPALEGSGGDMFFACPAGTGFLGLGRVAALLLLYGVAVAAALGAAQALFRLPMGGVLLQLLCQCVFFAALGFCLIVCTRSTGVSLAAVAAYVLAFQTGPEDAAGWANVFLRNIAPCPASVCMRSVLPVCAGWSAAFCLLGHLRLRAARQGR